MPAANLEGDARQKGSSQGRKGAKAVWRPWDELLSGVTGVPPVFADPPRYEPKAASPSRGRRWRREPSRKRRRRTALGIRVVPFGKAQELIKHHLKPKPEKGKKENGAKRCSQTMFIGMFQMFSCSFGSRHLTQPRRPLRVDAHFIPSRCMFAHCTSVAPCSPFSAVCFEAEGLSDM